MSLLDWRVRDAKEVIRKYMGLYGMLQGYEAAEIQKAYETIQSVRDKCCHNWELSTGFTSNQYRCKYCDMTEQK